jgi:protoheme IX farnesyltransferase
MKGHYSGMNGYLELCKLRISLFSALSAAMGFLLSAHRIGSGMLTLTSGVFILSCGACALNQYQDRDLDAIMPRTAGRPLPSGRIKPAAALNFALALICIGSLALFLAGRAAVALLGLFAVLWYNGVYAVLKRRKAFAAVPGSLIGAVPPAMGWVSGGGVLTDHRIVAVCFFFFMWQAPHFWLLLIDRGEEYRRAGLPSPAESFSKSQLRRILFIWISAAAVSALFIPMGGVVQNHSIGFFLVGASFWLVWNGVGVLRGGERDAGCIFAFRRINVFVLIVILLLSLDKLIWGFTL